jgi:hypothetical protein
MGSDHQSGEDHRMDILEGGGWFGSTALTSFCWLRSNSADVASCLVISSNSVSSECSSSINELVGTSWKEGCFLIGYIYIKCQVLILGNNQVSKTHPQNSPEWREYDTILDEALS